MKSGSQSSYCNFNIEDVDKLTQILIELCFSPTMVSNVNTCGRYYSMSVYCDVHILWPTESVFVFMDMRKGEMEFTQKIDVVYVFQVN